jgi:type I restriction enzyme S subunit
MVPKGYRYISGLGPIPDEWEAVPADNICSKITKGTTPPKSDIVEDSNIPFLRVNNLTFSGRLNKSNELLFVSDKAHRGFLARSTAYPGDILMNIVGPPLGKTALLTNAFSEYNLNQAIVIYRADSPNIDKFFFLSYLRSAIAQQWLQSRSKKTSGQQNLTIELCKELPVPLPPLIEQQKIGRILYTWECAIETVGQLIRKSEAQKAGLVQRLLSGDTRLTGFDKPWVVRRLGDLFTERLEASTLKLPLLSITSEKGVILQSEVGRKNTSNDDKSKYKRICPGDIGYNTMRMWQGVSALSSIEGIVSPAYTIVTSQGEIDSLYAAYLFKDPRTIHDFRRHSQGLTSDTWNLKFPLFARLEIQLPELEEQQEIARVLRAADNVLNALRLRLSSLQRERQALTQVLLSGKRRVNTANTERIHATG